MTGRCACPRHGVPARGSSTPLRVAAVIPLSGPAGLFGPSCEAVTDLALTTLNADDGILGRPVEAVVIDGEQPLDRLVHTVDTLIRSGEVDVITGWHISKVRQALTPITRDHVPYIYTSLYEGGESTPGVFCSGETPADQVLPALRWLASEAGAQRISIVGSDYVWPWRTSDQIRHYCSALGLDIVDESFVPYGTTDYGQVVDSVIDSGADTVVMLFVGQDAVNFNREFAKRGVSGRITRFTPLMEENMLLGSGADATENLFVAAGYFASLNTGDALHLLDDYLAMHGPEAPPLNNAAESCYEGFMALEALASRAASLDSRQMRKESDGLSYDGPRGAVRLRGAQVRQHVHLASADGLEFEVLARL